MAQVRSQNKVDRLIEKFIITFCIVKLFPDRKPGTSILPPAGLLSDLRHFRLPPGPNNPSGTMVLPL